MVPCSVRMITHTTSLSTCLALSQRKYINVLPHRHVNEDEVLELEKQYIQTMDKILKKKKRLAVANTQHKGPNFSSSVLRAKIWMYSCRQLIKLHRHINKVSLHDSWDSSFRVVTALIPCEQVLPGVLFATTMANSFCWLIKRLRLSNRRSVL